MKCQFQVGDRVRVRKDLGNRRTYYNYDKTEHNSAVSEMIDLAGKVVNIMKCNSGQYKIEEDGGKWSWVDEMFEDKISSRGTLEYKTGDKVLIRDDLISYAQYGADAFVPKMERFKGTICTISGFTTRPNGRTCYRIEEDNGKHAWTEEMFEGKVDQRQPFSYKLIEKDDDTTWGEWRETRKRFVWTTRGGESMLISGMKTGHIKNTLALLRKADDPLKIKDGVPLSIWIEIFEKELQYREMLEQARARVHEWLNKPQKENKENKEDIEMSNTNLIENKLEKELDALFKAKKKEIKDKFYETSIGKAAKAFNKALEQDGNENQKENCMIDEDDLMERSEENYNEEIDAKYDAKREEVKEYYAEAMSLFENADTYEQKHEILTAYGILKGPKAAKAKVEVK